MLDSRLVARDGRHGRWFLLVLHLDASRVGLWLVKVCSKRKSLVCLEWTWASTVPMPVASLLALNAMEFFLSALSFRRTLSSEVPVTARFWTAGDGSQSAPPSHYPSFNSTQKIRRCKIDSRVILPINWGCRCLLPSREGKNKSEKFSIIILTGLVPIYCFLKLFSNHLNPPLNIYILRNCSRTMTKETNTSTSQYDLPVGLDEEQVLIAIDPPRASLWLPRIWLEWRKSNHRKSVCKSTPSALLTKRYIICLNESLIGAIIRNAWRTRLIGLRSCWSCRSCRSETRWWSAKDFVVGKNVLGKIDMKRLCGIQKSLEYWDEVYVCRACCLYKKKTIVWCVYFQNSMSWSAKASYSTLGNSCPMLK